MNLNCYNQIMPESYEYENRKGIKNISWDDFYGLCKGLALAVEEYKPEIIVGIARGGLYPATLMSHMLLTELFVIRLTRRVNDKIVYHDPVWIQRPTEYLIGKRVLVVDEICDTGQTLRIVKGELEQIGASEVRTMTLYAHEKSADTPDYIGIVTDELILNPWDREVLVNGEFVVHPEYIEALKHQNNDQTTDYKLGIEAIKPEKVRN